MKTPFFSKIALIDLTNKTVSTESIDNNLYLKLLGGKGLGAYLLLHYLSPQTEPLSPDNFIIIANGALTGSNFPNSSRVELITKSPLTGTFLDSNAGGYLGRELKATGWDAIMVTGKVKSFSYLFIENEKIEFKDASYLAGMDPMLTEAHIKNELGDSRTQILSIGIAGENEVRFANVTTGGRHFGRGGAGAVMGSKNLKAIAIRGTHSLPWNEDQNFRRIVKRAYKKIRINPMTKRGGMFPTLGTLFTIGVVNKFGVFPSLNWQTGTMPGIEETWPNDFSDLCIKHVGCYRCPIFCRRLSKTGQDEMEKHHDGPEYESIYALGSNCGISDARKIVKLDQLCSKYGLDSISTGVVLSFATECFEKGLLSQSDIGGNKLSFGNADVMAYLIEQIALKSGIGRILSEGTLRAAGEIGGDASGFAMQVKGLELPGYDPRGMKTMAILYATSDRGGCHVRGSTLRSELLGLPEPIDRLSYKGKAQLAMELQRQYALMNSMSVCLFANFALTFDDYSEVLKYLFPLEWDPDNIMITGSRIWNLTRVFNSREGFGRDDDTLPNRLFYDPLPDGSSQGEVVDQKKFCNMLNEYYVIQGWDENGVPKETTLERLGIKELL